MVMTSCCLWMFIPAIAQQGVEFTTRTAPNSNIRSLNPVMPSAAIVTKVDIDNGGCVDPQLEKAMWKLVNDNIDRLGIRKPASALRTATQPSFIWPVQPKAGFVDPGYYTVQYLVDHNAGYNNQLQDYNCGTRTYDGSSFNHAGTDIILWPYAWRRMDEQVMEIVAAAPGIIVSKFDNNYDRKCLNNGQGVANGFHVAHDDGSITWYWHMKTGSLNPKVVGDTVVAGEYLGTAGSSGSSSWPHVHFQVWNASGGLIDPWDGSCNSMNPGNSWWQSQQAYNVPSVNRICTKKTAFSYYNCPTAEPQDERDTFYLGDTLAIWLYYRDLELNSVTNISLKNPSGQSPITFNFTSPWATSPTSYAAWYYLVDAWWTPGWWTFEAVYNGQTYTHQFYMTGGYAGMDEDSWKSLSVFPNPAVNEVTVSGISFSPGTIIQLIDPQGRIVKEHTLTENSTKAVMEISGTAAGMYLIKVKREGKETVRRLFISG